MKLMLGAAILLISVVLCVGEHKFEKHFNEEKRLWEYNYAGTGGDKHVDTGRHLLQDNTGLWYDMTDRHAGQKCVYFGLGSSLETSDLSWISDFDTVFTNVANHTAYGVNAKYFFDDGLHPVDILALDKDIIKFVDQARVQLPVDVAVKLKIVPMRIFASCEKSSCEYFSIDGSLKNDPDTCKRACDDCFCNPSIGTAAGGSPLYIALQIMYYLGCQTVYTVGVDDLGPTVPPYVPPSLSPSEVSGELGAARSRMFLSRALAAYKSDCRSVLDATQNSNLETPITKIHYRSVRTTRPDPTVTIFSIPKDFVGSDGDNQQLVLRSWLSLSPRPRVQLYGPARNIDTVKASYPMVEIYPDVQINAWGIPTLGTPFALAQASNSDVVIYANMDIMFSRNLTRVIRDVYHLKSSFLIVGLRYEVDAKYVRPALGSGDRALWDTASQFGAYGGETFFDYFIFTHGLFPDVPEFVAGRAYFDWYFLLVAARTTGCYMVDGSFAIGAYHMNHEYKHIQKQYQKNDGSTITHRNQSPDTIHNTLLYAHAAGQYEELLMSDAFDEKTGAFNSAEASKIFRSRDIILRVKDTPRYVTYEGNCEGEIRLR